MLQPERHWSSEAYRYGYNGKETDNEVSGTGNQYNYGFRIYNPRIARFLSVDPLTRIYPMLTPYQYASNTPIQAVDLDGLEALKKTSYEEQQVVLSINRYTIGKDKIVKVEHTSNGRSIYTELHSSGVSESQLRNMPVSTLWNNPGLFNYFEVLSASDKLARGIGEYNKNTFGVIANLMVENSGVDKDTYQNTFLHFTGQAIVSAMFSEQEAKFVADMHERDMTVFFDREPDFQKDGIDLFDAYEDRYRDLINNEWGRKFGNIIRREYKTSRNKEWTLEQTVSILNRIQSYLAQTFNIEFTPVNQDDPRAQKFTQLINEALPLPPKVNENSRK